VPDRADTGTPSTIDRFSIFSLTLSVKFAIGLVIIKDPITPQTLKRIGGSEP